VGMVSASNDSNASSARPAPAAAPVADRGAAVRIERIPTRDDDYASGGRPVCDWDDAAARADLVAALAADAHGCPTVLDGCDLPGAVADMAALLATVVGQDLEADHDGRFRIARRVAKDRVISTVDPDSEIITDTTVTPGNAGDGSVAETLIEDLLDRDEPGDDDAVVYGDSAYGGGEFQQRLEDEGINSGCRTQPPSAPKGRFGKDQCRIDLEADTVTCPNQVTVDIRRGRDGTGITYFADACADCPLRDACTEAASGRTIRVGIHEAALAQARQRQQAPEWQDDYRATRPKVERKLGHLMRRRHGGRRARVRGTPKVDADFNPLAAAANLARLVVLGLQSRRADGPSPYENPPPNPVSP
jgi:Transposase DDE domain